MDEKSKTEEEKRMQLETNTSKEKFFKKNIVR